METLYDASDQEALNALLDYNRNDVINPASLDKKLDSSNNLKYLTDFPRVLVKHENLIITMWAIF